ncbi:hypothetical protein SDC9_160139 [bioreactor metagenome]|uniref:Uncharacterized protein n=1 Tax=bioreactor metagenome TaxID=1076179 RepID=A0A645FHJ7_9ZZZZ
MHQIQQRREKHKQELNGFRQSRDEGRNGAGQKHGSHDFLALGPGCVIHGQGRSGQSKHHDGEETCHVLAGNTHHAARGRTPELAKVVNTRNVKPEHTVQRVVQAHGDQQAVEETVNANADGAKADDAGAEVDQRGVDERPQEEQRDADDEARQYGDDGHAAPAAEERQKIRCFGFVEFVVAVCRDEAAQNADELVVDFAKCGICLCAGDGRYHIRAEHCLHGQPGHQARKA